MSISLSIAKTRGLAPCRHSDNIFFWRNFPIHEKVSSMRKFWRTTSDAITVLLFAAILSGGGIYLIRLAHPESVSATLTRLKNSYPDVTEERALAETYWSHHQDVKNNPYFGKNGELGIYGAREHYRNAGKGEGRTWPSLN
jgi:hypothetical protein